MIKKYKKSFILTNLILVASVLLVVNIVIFAYSYHLSIEKLKTTMQQKIEPYDAINNFLAKKNIQNEPDPKNMPKPDEDKPDEKAPHTLQQSDSYLSSIFVFFYNLETENVNILSKNEILFDTSLSDTAKDICAQKDDFGRLNNIYYFKQQTGRDIKIAIASPDFIRLEMIKLFLLLVLIFLLTMLLFYFISSYLANISIKPLENSIARERQFITDISHDLKTPLTAILANTDILIKNKDMTIEEMYKWVDATKQAAQNMKLLTEQMLVLSKSEQPQKDIEIVNFSDIAEKNALVMESVAYEKNINYSSDINQNIFIKANSENIKRITASLIDNALKHENPGGNVFCKLYLKSGKAVFSVTNKTLIPKNDIEHIFERFYQSDKSRSSGTGHGLGLAITKNLVNSAGGSISVKSSEKTGTVFTVSFNAQKSKTTD